ncbi:hypothetical protein IT568_03580, partial [bacterium]|nr:hypothetical protein [bacterium]
MKTTSLILFVLLVSDCVFGQDNRLKVFSGYLNEAKSIKDIGISDTKLYVINSGINSNEEPLFEKQKTAASWTSKNIAVDLNDKTKVNTLVSGTFEPANSNREILFIGTTADEVRKYVGGVNQTNGNWLSGADSETNLPANFIVNVMHKYKDTGTLNDYVLTGLSGVQDGATLFKT